MFVRYSTCSHVCPVHVPMFVRASSLTFTYIHLVTFTSVTKHRSYSLSYQCHLIILACEATISILGGAHFDFQFYNICSVVLFNLTFHKTMSNSQGNKRKIVRLPEFPCSSTPEPVWHHSTYCTTVRTILSHLHVLYTVRTMHTVHGTHCTCSLFPCFRCWGFIFNICSPLSHHTCSLI